MTESVITIKSGTIKNRFFLKYSFEDKKESKTDTGSLSSDSPIHEDCKKAYHNLIPHFMLLCEQDQINDTIKEAINDGVKDLDDDNDESYFKDYRVTEFKISGTANAEGVVLVGQRYLSTGKSIGLSTPFIRWDDEDYKFVSELSEAVEAVREEVYQYHKGKHAPLPKQESFDFEEESLNVEEVTTPAGKFKKMVTDFKDQGIEIEVSASSASGE